MWYDMLYCDTISRIVHRMKYRLLSSAPGGSVLVETTYFYQPEYGPQPIQVVTVRRGQILFPERPLETAQAPSPDRELELDHVSVARVFAAPDGPVLASADYAPDGVLEALSVDGAANAQMVRAPNGRPVSVGTSYSLPALGTNYLDYPATRNAFGLLPAFAVKEYLAGAAPAWSNAAQPALAEVVYLHYNRGAIVRRDATDSAGIRSTRWLSFAVTPVDSMLAPLDASRPYGLHGRPAHSEYPR